MSSGDTESVAPAGATGRDPRRWDRLVAADPDLFSRHSPDGTFLEASAAAAPMLGLAAADLIGRRWHDLVAENDTARFAAWWPALSTGANPPLTFGLVRGGGSQAWLEATAVDTGTGEIEVHTRDVTHHRWEAEDLARRCAELDRQLAGVAAANRSLAALAAGAAHDLRGPLQGIAGLTEFVIRRNNTLDADTQEMLLLILQAAGGLRDLVEAASEHSRLTTEPIEPGPVDVAEAAECALARLAPEVAERNARIDVLALPRLRADQRTLTRALELIISRALVAARPQCIPRLVVSSRHAPSGWIISVLDDGERIPARERIFEIFGRGGKGGVDRRLALAAAVAERHGGWLRAHDVPGGGTRVDLYLPSDA